MAKLKLALIRQLQQRELSQFLSLKLGRKLGEVEQLAQSHTLDSAHLPFQLLVKINQRQPSHRLPFNLNRKLGTLDVVDDVVVTPTPIPPKTKRKMDGVARHFLISQQSSKAIADCQHWTVSSQNIAQDIHINPDPSWAVAICQQLLTNGFIPLAHHQSLSVVDGQLLANCLDNKISAYELLQNCIAPTTSATVNFIALKSVFSADVVHHQIQKYNPVYDVVHYQHCTDYHQAGQMISVCHHAKIEPAVAVPCRYYPIPPIPPEPPTRHCQVRLPSSRLPLRFQRKNTAFLSSALPLALQCWHDDEPLIVPNLGAYIVHNTISANIAGIAISPLSFSIKTDMNSYCWQGSVQITAKDYAKIKAKLDVEQGNEPLITVNINGHLFTLIAEEQSLSRQFLNHSYSLSGRSVTARLGADYAQTQNGLLDQVNYASQIVQQQLNGLSISVDEWIIADWLIPENVYSVQNKTPIAVINDIAQACGGFLTSHANEPKLSLKQKWKSPAWEIATATPDVVINLDVIRQINEQKKIQSRYNTVTLTGLKEGGIVYRQRENRQHDAPTLDNPLFTDRDCFVPMGIKVLSDSGTHIEYSITLRWADKYNLPLAKLGEIWQVNDIDGAWKGIITGVQVDVKVEQDVPTIWQTINIDRYFDI